jgi:hypothetical protein
MKEESGNDFLDKFGSEERMEEYKNLKGNGDMHHFPKASSHM